MIIYIDVIDNKLIIYGYKPGIEKKLNETGPKKSFATMDGYNIKPIKPTIPEYYFYGIFDNVPGQIDIIFNSYNYSKVFILPNAIKLFNYIKFGQGMNSYSDTQFKDPELIKSYKEKIIPTPKDFMEEYIDELKEYSKIIDKEDLNKFNIINEPKYWRLKTDKPRYIIGNTIVYYPDTNDYLCVSNGIDEKEYIKPNEIGRVISEINYTIIDKEAPMERIEQIYDFIKPHNKMDIPVLFKSSVIYSPRVLRMLMTYPKLKIDGYYNMMQYSCVDSTTIAFLYMPPALLYKIKDEFTSIRDKIMKEEDTWIDITEHFLENGKLKSKVDFSVTVKVDGIKVFIKTNVDTFNRHRLTSLEKDGKLFLYLYKTDKMVKYYTILVNEGLKHISYAPFNNLIPLR